jgi:hypothetical protein
LDRLGVVEVHTNVPGHGGGDTNNHRGTTNNNKQQQAATQKKIIMVNMMIHTKGDTGGEGRYERQ